MKASEKKVGFIGFGHMAQILFRALDRSRFVPRSKILFVRKDTEKMKRAEQEFGITATSLKTLVAESDLILLCVRPQQVDLVLEELSRIGVSGKKIVSILAGIGISYLEKSLSDAVWIRAMPNLAAEIGEAMTILSYGRGADSEFCSFANLLFRTMGEVAVLPEAAMDLVTGIAGSGPAYIFGLIEAAAKLGERGGIPYEEACKIAAQTFLGAAKMILSEKKWEISEQIQRIAVPGGTTEAGWKVFQDLNISRQFQSVIQAAADRSREISEQFSS